MKIIDASGCIMGRLASHAAKSLLNGDVISVPDEDDYPQGSPIGKRKLVEVRVDTWDGSFFTL